MNSASDLRPRFWETYDLADLTRPEWEALCDGCGKCCLVKLEDADSGDVHYTDVTCRLFDAASCQCGNYPLRKQMVAGCVVLTPQNLTRNAEWMPETCAYRRLHQGDTLPDWHPLLTGTTDSVAAHSVARVASLTPEYEVEDDDLEDHILEGYR